MSSILDALEKLERTRPPTLEPVAAVVPVPRRTRVFALVGGAFAAGAALALALLRTHPGGGPAIVSSPPEPGPAVQPAGDPVAPVPQPAAPTQPAPPSGQQAHAVSPPSPPAPTAPVPAPPNESAPAAQAEAPAAATAHTELGSTAPTAPTSDAPHPPTPDALAAARPVPAPSPTDPRPWASTVSPQPPPPQAAEVAAPREAPAQTYAHLEPPAVRRPPAGAPAVRLSFLLYSPAPGRRTVALAIENRGLETLHEGESSPDGVEVVRILPDRVELGWNGEHFTVRARD